jgi:hypothetical protein
MKVPLRMVGAQPGILEQSPARANLSQHDVEESFKLKRTFSLCILAGFAAAVLPLMAIGQVSDSTGKRVADETEKTYKYDAYAGYAYTSLNQVNQSRYGLEGVNVSVTRYFGRYFGVTAEGDDFFKGLKSGNPGNPKVQSVFFGPVLHANLYGKFDGFGRVLLGGEHTGDEDETPNISFAGGAGGGLEYHLTPRFSIRASGDDIAASFSLVGNSAQLGNSPHKTWNSRASVGVVYHF